MALRIWDKYRKTLAGPFLYSMCIISKMFQTEIGNRFEKSLSDLTFDNIFLFMEGRGDPNTTKRRSSSAH